MVKVLGPNNLKTYLGKTSLGWWIIYSAFRIADYIALNSKMIGY
jgi:hypothetical protein